MHSLMVIRLATLCRVLEPYRLSQEVVTAQSLPLTLVIAVVSARSVPAPFYASSGKAAQTRPFATGRPRLLAEAAV